MLKELKDMDNVREMIYEHNGNTNKKKNEKDSGPKRKVIKLFLIH